MHRRSLLLALALAALGTVVSGPLARATQPMCLVLNLRLDESYATLQAAVNAASAEDTLRVKGTCKGDTTVSKSLTIAGQSNPGFGPATLDGANSEATPGTVLTVTGGVSVSISGLTIRGGYGENGGGIRDEGGSLAIGESTVTGDTALRGGGIWSEEATVTLTRSTVAGN